MARPETHDDIELDDIEIAVFQVNNMGIQPDLLLGYAAFLKAMEKAKAKVFTNYNGVHVSREPNAKEKAEQLAAKQSSWDEGKLQYETYAAVGKTEYTYQESHARRWAEGEELPWPPVAEPIDSVDVTIANIDAAVSE